MLQRICESVSLSISLSGSVDNLVRQDRMDHGIRCLHLASYLYLHSMHVYKSINHLHTPTLESHANQEL
jgi:hypothetical protein